MPCIKMIKRPRFYRPEPTARMLRNAETPTETNLSSETLGKLLRVEVKDPTDVEWLAEKASYKARNPAMSEEQVENLIGRKQRVTGKNVSISQSSQNAQTEMEAIRAMLSQGLVDNTRDQAALFLKLTQVLKGGVSGLGGDMRTVIKALQALDVPSSPTLAGFPSNLVDGTAFKSDRGSIEAFIIAQKGPNLVPISTTSQPISVDDAYQLLEADNSRVLDLSDLTIRLKTDYGKPKTPASPARTRSKKPTRGRVSNNIVIT